MILSTEKALNLACIQTFTKLFLSLKLGMIETIKLSLDDMDLYSRS